MDTKESWKLTHFPEKQLNNGLWTLIYINGSNEANFLDFLVLGESENMPEINQQLKKAEVDAIKSIMNQKAIDTKSWLESNFEYHESCELGSICENSDWSSKSPDLSIKPNKS